MPAPYPVALSAGLLFGLLSAAGQARPAAPETPVAASTTAPATTTAGDVIGVRTEHLDAAFWLQQLRDADRVWHSPAALKALNRRAVEADPTLHDWRDLPAALDAETLRNLLAEKSPLPKKSLYGADGRLLSADALAQLAANLNTEGVQASNPVQLGLIVRRADMRSFPSLQRAYDSAQAGDIDRFQETGLFPGMSVALLHESADGQWWFAQSHHYTAWVQKKDVALGTREQIHAFETATDQLVVTGARAYTVFTPEQPAVSELALDMSVKLPRRDQPANGPLLNGQNAYAGHVVLLPTRDGNGRLQLQEALVPRNQDVRDTYLPLNERNILNQAFKFLGERYGWGHAYNGRDCSGFVGEVYRSMGLYLPRNAGDQAKVPIGDTISFDATSTREEKLAALKNTLPGDLVFIPGHVMMVIGQINGEPWIIHDVTGLSYIKPDGLYTSALNGVSVTPLLPLMLNAKTGYVDRITRIKRFR